MAAASLGCVVSVNGQASFQPLGFDGDPHGISADGALVVGAAAPYNWAGFRWTAAGGLQPLPMSVTDALSRDGIYIVGNTHIDDQSFWEAVRWSESGGLERLGTLPGGYAASRAFGANEDGSVIVGESSVSLNFNFMAFRWTQTDGITGLGFMHGGTHTTATGVSADGTVIVGYGHRIDGRGYYSGNQGFVWTAGNGLQSLGGLFVPEEGAAASEAFAISADSRVVVGQSYAGPGKDVAFRWTEGTGMEALGQLQAERPSKALAANVDGSIIVGASTIDDAFGPTWAAFLWSADSGMQNLRDLLVTEGATGLEGWRLGPAMVVSADGRTIGGRGELRDENGNYVRNEVWIATLSESCLPDLDGSDVLDLFDFLVFVNFFNAADSRADCDTNGIFDLFDFFCFVNAFNEGC